MIRKKYFVLCEGSDRAILRTSLAAAYRKKERIEHFNPGKKFIFLNQKIKLCRMKNNVSESDTNKKEEPEK